MKEPHIFSMEKWLAVKRDYGNHVLGLGRSCPKCGAVEVQPPAYPTDYFDCLHCGHSWAPTAKQTERMRNQ